MTTVAAKHASDSAVADTVEWLLRLGDDALILGHRLSEWCGHAHESEEDLALANIALDLLGQARLWLTLAGEREGQGRDEDALAYLRDGPAFRNLLLVEQPNGDFAQTMARQFVFDAWQVPLLHGLAKSADEDVAAIAAKSVKEAEYHLRHSSQWVVRLGDGTDESHRRMAAGLDEVWRYTGEMFVDDPVAVALADAGTCPLPSSLQPAWRQTLDSVLSEATLSIPDQEWMADGGRIGRHTEHLGYILADLQFLQRAYPGAQW